MDAQYIRDIDETAQIEVCIERISSSNASHYAKAYLWHDADPVAETRGTEYLDYCEACIAAREANKLPHGISFIPEDFRECECED